MKNLSRRQRKMLLRILIAAALLLWGRDRTLRRDADGTA